MSTNTANDLFGKIIAAELKQIPEERKSIVKREITDIVFDIKAAQLQELLRNINHKAHHHSKWVQNIFYSLETLQHQHTFLKRFTTCNKIRPFKPLFVVFV